MGVLDSLGSTCVAIAEKLVAALLIWLIGKWVINKILAVIEKGKAIGKLDPTVRSFLHNFLRILLYVILVIAIISVLGVPMASVITVLASCGVAVGMAMQGSLSNIAGGIMLLVFRPFSVGDYVSAAGSEGTVKDLSIFYTKLLTIDNKEITIPNGTLMNSTITNFSHQENRRVDLNWSIGKDSDLEAVRKAMLDVMNANDKILKDPAPFAEVGGGTEHSVDFITRAWCRTEDYWDVYFDLNKEITLAIGKAGASAPAVRVIKEEKK